MPQAGHSQGDTILMQVIPFLCNFCLNFFFNFLVSSVGHIVGIDIESAYARILIYILPCTQLVQMYTITFTCVDCEVTDDTSAARWLQQTASRIRHPTDPDPAFSGRYVYARQGIILVWGRVVPDIRFIRRISG